MKILKVIKGQMKMRQGKNTLSSIQLNNMIFSTKTEFRNAVHSHAIKSRRHLKITKNDKKRIYAKCGKDNCQWRIHAHKVSDECTFQIREYNSNHSCGRDFNVKNMKSKWLAEKYAQKFRSDPKRNIKGFRVDAMQDLRINVSRDQAYRAKESTETDRE
ncbi:UNVERIFIED_CONTAM: hypothetical protein Sradi_0402600 [Sesamum radiatum]|uniref:Transposase MuDR plant domain-containing protein n=1 Tax=Sesamum radiatum TaxID=300843 RepID=A0AAW2W4X0_SESRA